MHQMTSVRTYAQRAANAAARVLPFFLRTCGAKSALFARKNFEKQGVFLTQAMLGAALLAGAANVSAQEPRCVMPYAQSPGYSSGDPGARARNDLNEGIAYYDTGRFALASRKLKSALATGLNDEQEAAVAHKYLGFYYCLHNSPKQCETHLRRALALSPNVDIFDHERVNPKLSAVLRKVTGQRVVACSPEQVATMTQGTPSMAAPSAAPQLTMPPIEQAPARNASKGVAVLELDVRPWGEITLDRKKVGVTPPTKRIKIAPGEHDIEIRNGNLGVYRGKVQVSGGDTIRISHHF